MQVTERCEPVGRGDLLEAHPHPGVRPEGTEEGAVQMTAMATRGGERRGDEGRDGGDEPRRHGRREGKEASPPRGPLCR